MYKINDMAHFHTPDSPEMEMKEIVQRIKTLARRAPTKVPSQIIRQFMEEVQNKEVKILKDYSMFIKTEQGLQYHKH